MSADIVEYVDQKFRSGNSVPIDRAWLSADDWAQLRAEIGRLRGEVKDLEMAWRGEPLDPAPAMSNGVEAADVHLAAEMLTWGREEGLTVKQEAEVAAHAEKLFRLLRAADNRDAAGVLREAFAKGDAPTAGYEKYWDDTPAAVPAGEAVARGGECSFNCMATMSCDNSCKPAAQPADGEAVDFWVCPDCTHYYMTDGVICDCHGRAGQQRMRHVRMVPMVTTPPAAQVQAAPQEGEAPKLVRYGRGPAKSPYLLDQRDDGYWTPWHVAQRELARALATHPSACELGAVQELVADWRESASNAKRHSNTDYENGYAAAESNCANRLEAALQHRGDSQEVGRG